MHPVPPAWQVWEEEAEVRVTPVCVEVVEVHVTAVWEGLWNPLFSSTSSLFCLVCSPDGTVLGVLVILHLLLCSDKQPPHLR